MTEVLAFLLMLGCAPNAEVRIDHAIPYAGGYENGIVRVKDINNTSVLVHEIWHNCQEQKYGPIRSDEDHRAREHEAERVQRLWLQYSS